MTRHLKKAGLCAALAAIVGLSATPAEARRSYYGDRDDGDTAIIAGIAGLAIGAAIASNGRDRYYDDGYGYRDRRYGYYDRGYYPRRYYSYRYAPRYHERRNWRRDRGYYGYYDQPYRSRGY